MFYNTWQTYIDYLTDGMSLICVLSKNIAPLYARILLIILKIRMILWVMNVVQCLQPSFKKNELSCIHSCDDTCYRGWRKKHPNKWYSCTWGTTTFETRAKVISFSLRGEATSRHSVLWLIPSSVLICVCLMSWLVIYVHRTCIYKSLRSKEKNHTESNACLCIVMNQI
jgi:hypothetical protein